MMVEDIADATIRMEWKSLLWDQLHLNVITKTNVPQLVTVSVLRPLLMRHVVILTLYNCSILVLVNNLGIINMLVTVRLVITVMATMQFHLVRNVLAVRMLMNVEVVI